MKLAVPKEKRDGETRVAATPETVKKLKSLGLDVAIESLLHRHQLDHLPVAANHLEADGPRRWRLEFPHTTAECRVASGLCKCAQVAMARRERKKVLLVGDGTSDFCAAGAVDLVFAKHRLIEHCRAAGIPYVPITGFEDALDLLPQLLDGSLSGQPATPAPATTA